MEISKKEINKVLKKLERGSDHLSIARTQLSDNSLTFNINPTAFGQTEYEAKKNVSSRARYIQSTMSDYLTSIGAIMITPLKVKDGIKNPYYQLPNNTNYHLRVHTTFSVYFDEDVVLS